MVQPPDSLSSLPATCLTLTPSRSFIVAEWRGVKNLNLADNNLVRMGSLAPMVALEELRISGNNLEDMPGGSWVRFGHARTTFLH